MKGATLLRICIRYGLVAGLMISILMIILFYVGRHPFLIAPYLDFRILIFGVFLFFSLKEYRDFHQGGLLYFWQGIIGSFVLTVVSLTIGCLGLYVFGKLEPAFMERYISEMTFYLKSFPPENIEQIGKDVYERNLLSLPSTNIADLVKVYFFQGMIIGFFVSLILSVILRRTT